jgi:hypothetical protein
MRRSLGAAQGVSLGSGAVGEDGYCGNCVGALSA